MYHTHDISWGGKSIKVGRVTSTEGEKVETIVDIPRQFVDTGITHTFKIGEQQLTLKSSVESGLSLGYVYELTLDGVVVPIRNKQVGNEIDLGFVLSTRKEKGPSSFSYTLPLIHGGTHIILSAFFHCFNFRKMRKQS